MVLIINIRLNAYQSSMALEIHFGEFCFVADIELFNYYI